MAETAPRTKIVDQIRTAAPSRAGEKVVVACKLPNGIYVRAHELVEDRDMGIGGAIRDILIARPASDPVLIMGTNYKRMDEEGNEVRPLILPNGYALTTDVPADIWDQWLKANKDTPMVRNHLIFAMPKEEDARAEAKNNKGVRSGLEPLKVGKDAKGRPLDDRVPTRIEKANTKDLTA